MRATQIPNFEQILQRIYPRVYRIALALCGDRQAGQAVVGRVLGRSGVIFDRLEAQDEAERWFLRYTVLCSREYSPAGSAADPLFAVAAVPRWQAMVVALRHLPMQQREAFLLHHGEKLELRQLAIAMDCSSSAAANHLKAAEQSLEAISGGNLGDFANALPGLLNQLVPAPGMVAVQINRFIRRRRRKIWIRRWVFTPLKWGLVAGVGWVIWKLCWVGIK